MPSAVHVANRLSELTVSELTELLEARPYQLGRQHDLHDVADTLLTAESIAPTLRSLSRESLLSLSGVADDVTRGLMLAGQDGTTYPEVTALLPALIDNAIPAAPAAKNTDASTLVHTVVAIRDLIDWTELEPIPMSATGIVLKSEEKLLASELVIPETEVHAVVWMAIRAGLVRIVDRQLRVTSRGLSLRDDMSALWTAAVTATMESLGRSVRDSINIHSRLDAGFLDWAWPLRDANASTVLEFVCRSLDMLGLVAGATTKLGHAVLSNDKATVNGLEFPALVGSVYVLDDLSIIAPGPVTTATTKILDTISTVETRALGAKRRLNAARILRSIAHGETVESLTESLARVSLTPLTPAVTSTITDIATNTRFVALNGTGTDTAAKASHPELGTMLLTDPRLQRLAPVFVDATTVLYGASRERVETALVEGRYTVVTPHRAVPIADDAPPSAIRTLAESLAETGLGSTHLERALMVAGKARSRVTVVIETGTGQREITLEPRHVANGRVRGLDTGSDVERTFPISAIVELKAVGE